MDCYHPVVDYPVSIWAVHALGGVISYVQTFKNLPCSIWLLNKRRQPRLFKRRTVISNDWNQSIPHYCSPRRTVHCSSGGTRGAFLNWSHRSLQCGTRLKHAEKIWFYRRSDYARASKLAKFCWTKISTWRRQNQTRLLEFFIWYNRKTQGRLLTFMVVAWLTAL